MDIPDKVKIGPYIYQVRKRSEAFRNEDGDFLWGQIDYVNQQVIIGPTVSRERLFIELLHEAMHGILEVAGLSDHESIKVETVIEALGPGLYMFLKENGFLREDEHGNRPGEIVFVDKDTGALR